MKWTALFLTVFAGLGMPTALYAEIWSPTLEDSPMGEFSEDDLALFEAARLAKLAYTWSFYHEDKVELGLSVGGYLLSYDIELNNRDRTIVAEEDISEPLPLLGVRADYAINSRWHALFDMETFYIELGDDLRGSLDEWQLALEYRPYTHVSFGASFNRLAVDVEVDDDDWRGAVSDLYRGAQLYAGLRY